MTRTALLRDRALLALLARDVVSTAGSQMTWVALPWFVLTTTGSATKMAFVVAAEAAGVGLVGFAAGSFVGRLGLRRTMLVCDACRAPLVAAIPLLYAADMLSFGEDEGVLGEANALLQASMRIALVLGPVLAGVLIGLVGATAVLYIDAATFAIGFLLVALFIRVEGVKPDTDESRGLAAGIRFLLGDRLLRPWSIAVVLGDTAWIAFFVAVPYLVLTRFGEQPEILGWLLGAWGAGAVLGSVVIFRLARRVDGLLLGSIGEVLMIVPIWCFLADLPAGALVAAMFASGLANGLINAPIWTIFTLRTPAALRPKAWAAIIATTSLLGPLALLCTGPALDSIGLTATLLVILLVQTCAALLFMSAGLRERLRHGVSSAAAGAEA